MNIEQAKSIPLAQILDKLGHQPTQQKKNEAWYRFRDEKTASFKINIPMNVWYDFGVGRGGGAISFVQYHLELSGENFAVTDALRWLTNMMGNTPKISPVIRSNEKEISTSSSLFVDNVSTIKHELLIEYLEKRGIPVSVARRYMKEVKVVNRETKKYFKALGMRNEDGGWEVRNAYFKGCIGRKNITVIRGSDPNSNGFHVFEGGLDFLSAIIQKENGQHFKEDIYISHSVSILPKVTPYIKDYERYEVAYTWMDNDEAGKKATVSLDNFFKTQDQLLHKPQNRLYRPYKDVNAWHMVKIGIE
ncbi:toprim domain-containing protein [Niabella hibiscisoli]|uniref:toprim domain-containing protein n=1 Tax=Niabella hibiscisoli TaxID=1825928 RepID=UPI001F10D1E0|nr:toprim domain-containing protein [Niabella hibiscisoli]MCH5716692.1 toprim domain-containing protein [Niabella hibiscisoli]